MEGSIYYKKPGVFKGYNKFYAKIDQCSNDFVMYKKSYDGKEYRRFSLKHLLIYPIVINQTDFLIVMGQTTYRLRADSPFKRYQWVLAINEFSKNLTEELQVLKFPILKGVEYKKDIDPLQGNSQNIEDVIYQTCSLDSG